jgi:hypothetical protein
MRDPDGYLIEVGQSTGLLHGKLAAKRPEDLPAESITATETRPRRRHTAPSRRSSRVTTYQRPRMKACRSAPRAV